MAGTSLPLWLTMPGTVLLQRHIDHSTYDLLVREVELGESNILICHPDTNNMSSKNSLKDLNLELLDQNTYDSSRLGPPKIGPPKF